MVNYNDVVMVMVVVMVKSNFNGTFKYISRLISVTEILVYCFFH